MIIDFENPEFDRVIQRRGVCGSLTETAKATRLGLAEYIVGKAKKDPTFQSLTPPQALRIYHIFQTNSPEQIIGLLSVCNIPALRMLLLGNPHESISVSLEVCEAMVAQLNQLDPAWWQYKLEPSREALAERGTVLVDIVPGFAWDPDIWSTLPKYHPLRDHINARITATGCDSQVALQLFAERMGHVANDPAPLSLNRFCDILTSLQLATAK